MTGQTPEHSRDEHPHPGSTSDHEHGFVGIAHLGRCNAAAALGSPPQNGIGLVDHPIQEKNDGREPGWYYDSSADCLVVSAEWYNPMQYAVSIARALASEKTLDGILANDRLTIEDGLNALPIEDPTLLRKSRCLGYLADSDATAENYLDALSEARRHLEDLTRQLPNAKGDHEIALRSQITRDSHGLAGTLVHLLDLAGVNVVREVRLHHFRRDYSSKRKSDLLKNLAITAAIQSKYRTFSAFRQLFEDRPEKRDTAITPEVDAQDPYGRLIGSFTIVGPGVSDLSGGLRDQLQEPYPTHDESPDFAVRIPIEDRTRCRLAFEKALSAISRRTDYSFDLSTVSFLRQYTGTPYDAAKAAHRLVTMVQQSADSPSRVELRRALQTLPPERIVPSESRSVSKAVHTLLFPDEQYSQSGLAKKAGVSSRSLRRHKERLTELDVLQKDGRSLVFRFPPNPMDTGSWESIEPDATLWQPKPPQDGGTYGQQFSEPVATADELIADGGTLISPAKHHAAVLMGSRPSQSSLQDYN